ncbi:WD40 repeat-like protein [Rhizoctonia solani]|uniref:WD40 repeat-like protein n=1 Tax=Rhizoctonia solani TaxID=456999 RepID=A0A8H7I8V1_9AGAM|nr:WD40 repeat-like protein [Rhizoctonia solani]
MKATYDPQLSSSTNRRTCTEGTRVQVLHKLKGWVYNTRGQAAYWMSGMAGTGKTTIACTFAEWLEREAAGAKLLLHAASADCQDVTRMIPTGAYQLTGYSVPFQLWSASRIHYAVSTTLTPCKHPPIASCSHIAL